MISAFYPSLEIEQLRHWILVSARYSEQMFFFALGLFGSRFSTECHVSLYLFGDLTSVIFPMIDGQKRRDFLVVERTIRKNYK